MVLAEFIRNKNIDGNVYLLKDSNMKKGEICRITGIKSIPTVTRKLDYIKNNNIEIELENIPQWVYDNLNVPYLVKVWLLYCNGIDDVRAIIKMMGIGDTQNNLDNVTYCLECIRKYTEVKKISSGRMEKEEVLKKLKDAWGK